MKIIPGVFYWLKIDGINRSLSIIKVKEVKVGIPPLVIEGEILNPDGTMILTNGLDSRSQTVIHEHQIDGIVKRPDFLDIKEREESRLEHFFGQSLRV